MLPVTKHGQVLGVAVDGQQIGEFERIAALLQALLCLVVPEGLQVAVDLGEAAGQR
ncbi:hypothetical protein D3C78_1898860 [compost metagenome]